VRKTKLGPVGSADSASGRKSPCFDTTRREFIAGRGRRPAARGQGEARARTAAGDAGDWLRLAAVVEAIEYEGLKVGA